MINRIAHHFQGRWRRGYVRGKLRSDPAYAAVFQLLQHSPWPVLDIGCGIGLLAFYLREQGFVPPLTGIDFDSPKIAQARDIAARAYRDLTFLVRDALATDPFQGNIVLLDVLHYLPATRHAAFLQHLASLVAPGGVCVIRATPRDASWRFRVTQFQEVMLHAIRWMKSRALHYPAVEEIVAPFRARGFHSEVRPLWGRTPFNSHLFVFRAPPATATAITPETPLTSAGHLEAAHPKTGGSECILEETPATREPWGDGKRPPAGVPKALDDANTSRDRNYRGVPESQS